MGFEGEHTRDAYQYRTSVEPRAVQISTEGIDPYAFQTMG